VPDRRNPAASPHTVVPDRESMLAKFAAIVESSPEAMIACTPEGQIEACNRGAMQVFGLRAEELVGHNISRVIPPTHRDEFLRLLTEAGRGAASVLYRSLGVHKAGHLIHISVTLSPLRAADGKVTGACIVARDVSAWSRAEEEAEAGRRELVEREASLRQALTALRSSHEEVKRTQLQLIQSAKLESVGRLAAGVAHEVKNPLAMILAGTEYLISLPASAGGPAVEPVLRDIRAAVERASSVIGGLLNYSYSASTDLKPSEAEINPVVEQSLLLIQHAIRSGRVRIEKELTTGLPRLNLDVPKIEQVLINLLINSIDAMPDGGTLTIRTQRKQLTAADHSAGLRRTDPLNVGESVILVTIEDTGTGIAPEHLPRLFDPFFTTKPTGKGTGLGLAVSKTIVALHGGTIWMANRPEGGASVTVVFRSVTA
jgi:PAS domain S-box-containing protein